MQIKIAVSLLILMLAAIPVSGAADNAKQTRAISAKDIAAIVAECEQGPRWDTLAAALQNRSFSEIFKNQQVLKNHNFNFTHEIETAGITDQKGTGRCWMYAGLNAVRPKTAKKLGLKNFEFSENYLFFWDKFEKANSFFERLINRIELDVRHPDFQRLLGSPVNDGGYWQNFVDLVKKYGCVPYEAMPEVEANHSSRYMNFHLTRLLRARAYQLKKMQARGKTKAELRQVKKQYLAEVYHLLRLYLGEPVREFPFRYYKKNKKGEKKLTPYKNYTPREFAARFIEEDLDDFVMFANWPAREFNRFYKWESSSNLVEGTLLNFVNLPMEDIRKMMIKSILNDAPVNFSADVGKQSDRKSGIMHAELYPAEKIFGIDFEDDKGVNSVIRNINSTHAMVILGVDLHEGKPVKWKVENSWGSRAGKKGFYAMYDNWLNEFVVRVVLDKKFVDPEILKLFSEKAVLIPENEPEQ